MNPAEIKQNPNTDFILFLLAICYYILLTNFTTFLSANNIVYIKFYPATIRRRSKMSCF